MHPTPVICLGPLEPKSRISLIQSCCLVIVPNTRYYVALMELLSDILGGFTCYLQLASPHSTTLYPWLFNFCIPVVLGIFFELFFYSKLIRLAVTKYFSFCLKGHMLISKAELLCIQFSKARAFPIKIRAPKRHL